MLRTIAAGLRALFRRSAADTEIADEIRHYLDMATAEHVRAGLSPEAAARAARAEMGGIEATKERVRAGGWEAHVEAAWRDVRYAFRGFRRNPGFTAVALLTLALGTGATTAMFSVVNAVMLRPLPYRDAGGLVLVWTDDVRRGLHREPTAYRTITDWSARNHSFEDVAFFTRQRVAPLSSVQGARGRAMSALVSGNLFDVLGVPPALGRPISKADDTARSSVVVISHGFWQRWFAGAPDVVGKALLVDDGSKGGTVSLTVIGVMPQGFYFPNTQTELWTPAATYWRFARESGERFHDWARRWTAVARLRSGVTLQAARQDMAGIGRDLAATYKSNVADFPGFTTTMTPMLDAIANVDLQAALWILLGATVLVLLVACANVANLLLARGAARQHEFAVRRALGGGRGRLLRQLAIEHIVLALTGGAAGLLIASWSIGIFRTAAAPYVPRIDEISIDFRVLVVTGAVSLAAAVLFGMVPASRLSGADANETLKEGGRGTGSARARRSRGVLVLVECALAVVLLAGAGLLLRSLDRLLSIDPGFDPRGVLVVRLEFPSDPPPSAEERTQPAASETARARARAQLTEDLIARVHAIPGVEAAGFVDDLFVAGQGNDSITIPGRAASEAAGELNSGSVTPQLFAAMRVGLRRGRYLTTDDTVQKIRALWSPIVSNLTLVEKERLATPEPVVVNEAFVRRFFANDDPIGKRFCIDPTAKTYWYEIVGVIGDMHRQGLERRTIPEYFGPYFPSPNGRADMLVRARLGDPLDLAAAVRQEVARAFPAASIATVSTASAQFAEFSSERRLQTSLLTAFAVLALSLAAIGIFGLVRYTVAERRGELGVRIALGATPGDILLLVLGQGLRMPAVGIALGLAAAAGLTRLMARSLFGVTPTDPLTFAAVAGILAVVVAAASYLGASRTTRVDPLQVLRQS